jgi:ABC-type glutathione transport system ATPase component
MTPLIDIRSLSKTFFTKQGPLPVLRSLSLSIYPQETLGLLGPSGSGKSTLAKILLRLLPPSSGEILFQGAPLGTLPEKTVRASMQMVFQDPLTALNPRFTVEETLCEPFLIHRLPYSPADLYAILDAVGLPRSSLSRYPHQFSGGQRQRINIARALLLRPRFILLDEPLSALDVSIQAQILTLLQQLQRDFQLTYLFISHDLAVVKYLSDRIALLDQGAIAECAPAEQFFSSPRSEAARRLLTIL